MAILLVCFLSACAGKHRVEPKARFYDIDELSCDSINSLASQHHTSPISVTWTNTRDENVELFWINHKGKEVSYGIVGAAETRGLTTYITHAWVIRNNQKDCLTVFNPIEKSEIADMVIR